MSLDQLKQWAANFEDGQKTRMAMFQREKQALYGAREITKDETKIINERIRDLGAFEVEKKAGALLEKVLQQQDVWPWLEPLKGLAGARTARIIAAIGDPQRFPGQPCTLGHITAPLYGIGAACPFTEITDGVDQTCGIDAVVGPVRTDGVDVRDGIAPAVGLVSKTGGVERSYEVDGRAGLAGTDEAVRQAEIGVDRGLVSPDGTEPAIEIEASRGSVNSKEVADGAEARREIEAVAGSVSCPGVMLEPRRGQGVRSLWHYSGLHVVEGALPKRRKGQQSDWSPRLRTLLIGPEGTADQIIKHRTLGYRELYETTKERKLAEEMPPWKAHKIARVVAAKAFEGDLFMRLKRGADSVNESEQTAGPSANGGGRSSA